MNKGPALSRKRNLAVPLLDALERLDFAAGCLGVHVGRECLEALARQQLGLVGAVHEAVEHFEEQFYVFRLRKAVRARLTKVHVDEPRLKLLGEIQRDLEGNGLVFHSCQCQVNLL